MKERPILFSAPMVRALLDGTKTQTRRVLKRQPEPPRAIYDSAGADTTITPHLHRCENGIGVAWRFEMSKIESSKGRHLEAVFIDHEPVRIVCPYGQPGDRLWVREAWAPKAIDPECTTIAYRATDDECNGPWKPSIHMPRWASRIDLEVTAVRVERLQDISEVDAIAEGIGLTTGAIGILTTSDVPIPVTVAMYRDLWTQINGAGSWDANPWVWVVEFRRVRDADQA